MVRALTSAIFHIEIGNWWEYCIKAISKERVQMILALSMSLPQYQCETMHVGIVKRPFLTCFNVFQNCFLLAKNDCLHFVQSHHNEP